MRLKEANSMVLKFMKWLLIGSATMWLISIVMILRHFDVFDTVNGGFFNAKMDRCFSVIVILVYVGLIAAYIVALIGAVFGFL